MHKTIAVLALGLAAAFPAAAQEKFPSRPIELIVLWGPGGANQLARKLARGLEKDLKVSPPAINVAGAIGQTGLTKMLAAPADDYSDLGVHRRHARGVDGRGNDWTVSFTRPVAGVAMALSPRRAARLPLPAPA